MRYKKLKDNLSVFVIVTNNNDKVIRLNNYKTTKKSTL